MSTSVVDLNNPSTSAKSMNDCQTEIEMASSVYQMDTTGWNICLDVVWEFDVAATFKDAEGNLSARDFVSGKKTLHSVWGESGRPGTDGNALEVFYPLPTGKPEGVLYFQTGSNSVGWTENKWQVPTADFRS